MLSNCLSLISAFFRHSGCCSRVSITIRCSALVQPMRGSGSFFQAGLNSDATPGFEEKDASTEGESTTLNRGLEAVGVRSSECSSLRSFNDFLFFVISCDWYRLAFPRSSSSDLLEQQRQVMESSLGRSDALVVKSLLLLAPMFVVPERSADVFSSVVSVCMCVVPFFFSFSPSLRPSPTGTR